MSDVKRLLDAGQGSDMRGVVEALRVAFEDADAVTVDMLKPPRRRDLGPVEHARLYEDARASIVEGLARMARLAGGEGASPS